jgi:hypothetical protein
MSKTFSPLTLSIIINMQKLNIQISFTIPFRMYMALSSSNEEVSDSLNKVEELNETCMCIL